MAWVNLIKDQDGFFKVYQRILFTRFFLWTFEFVQLEYSKQWKNRIEYWIVRSSRTMTISLMTEFSGTSYSFHETTHITVSTRGTGSACLRLEWVNRVDAASSRMMHSKTHHHRLCAPNVVMLLTHHFPELYQKRASLFLLSEKSYYRCHTFSPFLV